MPSIFWSGKLTAPMKVLVEANNLLSLITGSANDLIGMKERVKKGYEGEYSDHVHHYDELGYRLQDRSARIQLEGISFEGMRLLDVGCGTGALACVAFENGAKGVVCGDIAAFMLKKAVEKAAAGNVEYSFCQLDAEGLPYKDNSFDAVISGMTFGTLPDQMLALDEMVRVVKPGVWFAWAHMGRNTTGKPLMPASAASRSATFSATGWNGGREVKAIFEVCSRELTWRTSTASASSGGMSLKMAGPHMTSSPRSQLRGGMQSFPRMRSRGTLLGRVTTSTERTSI